MRIITLHCNYKKFKPLKKALKQPEELSEEKKEEIEIKECLVVLTAVEKPDTINLVTELVKNIEEIAKQVNAKKIVLYPYAHLSSNLSSPDIAQAVLEKAEQELKKAKYEVTKAPFGYYKEFELKCKGHPLSELSRTIGEREIEGKETKSKIQETEKYDYKQLLREISRSKLDTTKLKDNDHRILGQKLKLFSFNEVAPGMVFWHNNGLVIYNELINYLRELHKKADYQEISTPQVMDNKLWKISGHWEKYKENIFITNYEDRSFAVKPMNCPGAMLVYKSEQRSYKELPLRFAELGIVHRQELSGVLAGLFRAIKFTQDDAHIFCNEDQIESEIKDIISMIDEVYKKFNFTYHVELSTRPEKRIGSEATWNKSEKALEDVLKKNKIKYKVNNGDGAFYGPKIDFHIKDSLDRTWQCATIQLDFSMPERFELTYVGKDNKEHRPVMVHRAIYGSLERFIGILLEHTNGNLPLWLSPIQARVLSFTTRNVKKAQQVYEKLRQEGIRVDEDLDASTVNEKVRNAELLKIPYMIVIGDKEEKSNTLAVRKKGKKPQFGIKIDKFIEDLKEKISKRE